MIENTTYQRRDTKDKTIESFVDTEEAFNEYKNLIMRAWGVVRDESLALSTVVNQFLATVDGLEYKGKDTDMSCLDEGIDSIASVMEQFRFLGMKGEKDDDGGAED